MVFLRLIACMVCALPLCALDVGQGAPSLLDVDWVGQPPAPQSGNRLTLIVLWSPEDPVYRAILPRMTDLAHRHPEVRVVALSTAEPAMLAHIARAQGSKAGIPLGHLGSLTALMPPVGLPCAVLTDGHGIVLWWGHPLDAPSPVADALEGCLHVEIPPEAATGDMGPPAAGEVHADAAPPVPAAAQDRDRDAGDDRGQAPPRSVVVVEPDPWWVWGIAPVGCRLYLPLPPLLPLPFWHVHGGGPWHGGGIGPGPARR